jgi:transposase InsO family protein
LRIKKIRSDNGMEFTNSQIEGFLEEEGIKHEFSSPYTPQQNGVVERKNRTLLDMVRTMLDEYKTPDRFWAEAINTACYSINRLYLHRILKKTSYELLTGKKPNVSYFRVFGSKCFILIKRGRKSKFVSAFRTQGVPGPTSKLSPRAPAQMGRRETEREGGKKPEGDRRER